MVIPGGVGQSYAFVRRLGWGRVRFPLHGAVGTRTAQQGQGLEDHSLSAPGGHLLSAVEALIQAQGSGNWDCSEKCNFWSYRAWVESHISVSCMITT